MSFIYAFILIFSLYHGPSFQIFKNKIFEKYIYMCPESHPVCVCYKNLFLI